MEYLRVAIELLKALAWPALALYVLVVYRDLLRGILRMLPAKLEQTSKVSVGSLVFEMQTTLTNVGDPALAKELPNLSRAAYQQLLTMGDEDAVLTLFTLSGTTDEDGKHEEGIVLANPEELAVARELVRVGLIESTEPLEDFIQFATALPQSPAPLDEGTWIPRNSLSDAQYTRLTMHFGKITPRGLRLYEVMIGVVLSTLTKK